jgi:hypothetical protein
MKTRYLAVVSFAFSFFLLSLVTTTAQDRAAALLSDAEVQQLTSRGEPGDHARLRAHYEAVAAQYTAETQRHNALARGYAGNTKLSNTTEATSAHCKRLADISQASATTAREMAAEHGKLAGGATAPAPARPAQGQAARRTGTLSDTELLDLVAKASTAADHRKMEEYFNAEATRYEREGANHTAYARSWRATAKAASAATIAAHCDRIAAQRGDAAKELRAMATMHKEHAAQIK